MNIIRKQGKTTIYEVYSKLCRISGFHSGGFEEYLLLGYGAV
jgi:hypothetical protein